MCVGEVAVIALSFFKLLASKEPKLCVLQNSGRMHSRAHMLLEKEWFKLQKEELPWVSSNNHTCTF